MIDIRKLYKLKGGNLMLNINELWNTTNNMSVSELRQLSSDMDRRHNEEMAQLNQMLSNQRQEFEALTYNINATTDRMEQLRLMEKQLEMAKRHTKELMPYLMS